MIVKKMKRTNFSKSKAVMISELVDYIFAAQDDQGKEKLAHFGALNFLTTTRAAQKNEMIALAEESIQSKMPVTHWILSWKDEEQPTPEKVDFAVRYFLGLMEWGEHQAFYTVHKNTANLHVHILVNRVHPDTLKVHRPNRGFDIERAHLAIAKLERIQGWASEENSVYKDSWTGRYFAMTKRDSPKLCSGAGSLENATGEKSAQRIARERGQNIIKEAASWQELHEGLVSVGLRFEKKGSGALVWVGDVAVKVSSVDRAFSLPKLVKKLGEYEEGNYPTATFKPEPVAEAETMFENTWQEYQQEKAAEKKKRALIQKMKKDTLQQWEEERIARRNGSLRKLSGHGLPMINIGRHFLKMQQAQEKKLLRQTKDAEPQDRIKIHTFRSWLKKKNLRAAHFWRHRKNIPPDWDFKKISFEKSYASRPDYQQFLEKVRKEFPERADGSRIDARIAQRMRMDGHDANTTINTIYRESEWAKLRASKEDRLEYVSRVAHVSFGTVGTLAIAQMKAEEEMKKRQEVQQRQDEGYSFSLGM